MRFDLEFSLKSLPTPFYSCVELIMSHREMIFKCEITGENKLIDKNLIADLKEAISEMESHNLRVKEWSKIKQKIDERNR